jgi:hypothetical protein
MLFAYSIYVCRLSCQFLSICYMQIAYDGAARCGDLHARLVRLGHAVDARARRDKKLVAPAQAGVAWGHGAQSTTQSDIQRRKVDHATPPRIESDDGDVPLAGPASSTNFATAVYSINATLTPACAASARPSATVVPLSSPEALSLVPMISGLKQPIRK